ncbi:hypothetical protein EDC90_102516 [Martelella mediterranea]|uniref:DUF6456 domain-containing protein n=2 Tax=Martelella mediterranea TaxID=293089 RepID=A0A4R3NME3_9HYPH|nr:hypothetical protein EDC90_102516 [Martelella mediterranea]
MREINSVSAVKHGEKSPLMQLSRLKDRNGSLFLTCQAVEAGARIARDFDRAQMQPNISASLMPRLETRTGGVSGGDNLSDIALDARRRVRHALKAIGPELADVVLDFCCFEKGLEQIERERQWPVRSAKVMVRTALQALARHYAPPNITGGIRHWGDDGYRPDLSALFRDER